MEENSKGVTEKMSVILLNCPLNPCYIQRIFHIYTNTHSHTHTCTHIDIYRHYHFIIIDSQMNISQSCIKITAQRLAKFQTQCISLNLHRVRIATLKPWSFSYNFRLLLSITFYLIISKNKKSWQN